jgi:uncharacterized protein YuzE
LQDIPTSSELFNPKAAEGMTPELSYDADANAAYIRLLGAEILESEEVSPGVVLDFDAQGHIVGIELLDAKAQLAQELLAAAV